MWRFLILFPSLSLFADLSALYLSWYDDPATTMAIQWHTTLRDPRFDPENVNSNTISLAGPEEAWQSVDGSQTVLGQLVIHKVILKNLNPDTEYTFSIDSHPKIYRFRTAPSTLQEPLRFIIGSDLYASAKMFRRMSKTAMQQHPHFAIISSQIAPLSTARPFPSSLLRRWCSFLKDWKDYMIDTEGRILPFLLSADQSEDPDLLFTLFAFPEKRLYRSISFGNYLNLIFLDTGHLDPIGGEQTRWLENTFLTSSHPFRFAVYDQTAHSAKDTSLDIQAHWIPLFEEHGLSAAFENNSNSFTRTYPLKAGHIDPSGITYFGDKTWNPSLHNSHKTWHLAKQERKNSLILVELSQDSATVFSLDLLSHPLDEVAISPINK